MKKLLELSNEEARKHFLKGSSYFHADTPPYISFEPLLADVAAVMQAAKYHEFRQKAPNMLPAVNYTIVTNKDGKLAWRPLELIHPVIYVSLVNVICDSKNWTFLTERMSEFDGGAVECCSAPVMSLDHQKDAAAQVRSWWQTVEQRSLIHSLEYSHVLHTDVVDCYGAIYTHSIAWALHSQKEAKKNKNDHALLGNNIDAHIQAGRYGQTNGISQGSVLMDFVAEMVLGYVDEQVNNILCDAKDFRILRYRDDYRIFANSDDRAEEILRVISDQLRSVGMKLGAPKTFLSRNVIEGSIKPDKLAGIGLQDLGDGNAKTIQKQLLRVHSFGQQFPGSGAMKRLVSALLEKIANITEAPDDLEVQVAIATDIGFVSPSTFPAVAAILSHLIALAPTDEKARLWEKVRRKMARVPHNGFLEIWRLFGISRGTILPLKQELICFILGFYAYIKKPLGFHNRLIAQRYKEYP